VVLILMVLRCVRGRSCYCGIEGCQSQFIFLWFSGVSEPVHILLVLRFVRCGSYSSGFEVCQMWFLFFWF
jgi:hypothetical protein